MDFYLIDPVTGSLDHIIGSPTLQQIYKLLDCHLIDAVRIDDSIDVYYCDDEALIRGEVVAGNYIAYSPRQEAALIAGKIIYLGTNYQGDNASPEDTFQFRCQFPTGSIGKMEADCERAVKSTLVRFVRGDDGNMYPGWYTPDMEVVTGKGFKIIKKTLEEKLDEIDKAAQQA